MKLNNVEVSVINSKIDSVDDEYLMYDPNSNNAFFFNRTASIVWNYILLANNNNRDITTNDCAEEVRKYYGLPQDKLSIIAHDVELLLNRFLDLGLLILLNKQNAKNIYSA